MTPCDHEGEIRGHIEVHCLDGEQRWAAHAYIVGKTLPELVVLSDDDPEEAIEGAGMMLGMLIKEIDEIDLEEAA